MKNLLSPVPAHLPDELTEILLVATNVRVERIVSHGHVSPTDFWYDQDQQEWVLLVQGAARLRFEDKLVEMRAGDFLSIAAHQKHRVDWTTPDAPTIWLAIHYG